VGPFSQPKLQSMPLIRVTYRVLSRRLLRFYDSRHRRLRILLLPQSLQLPHETPTWCLRWVLYRSTWRRRSSVLRGPRRRCLGLFPDRKVISPCEVICWRTGGNSCGRLRDGGEWTVTKRLEGLGSRCTAGHATLHFGQDSWLGGGYSETWGVEDWRAG